MADVVDSETRSRMMAGIRNRNTRPEIHVRKLLHARGYRYRLGSTGIPGKPDIVLPKYRVVVFVHGCFWHGHQCEIFRWPKSNQKFWRTKIGGNMRRDQANLDRLIREGWSVLTVWECVLRHSTESQIASKLDRASQWIRKVRKRPGRHTLG